MTGRDVKITWYGHGTWGYESTGGVRVLVDPYLTDNPKTPERLKRVEALDVLLITHGHSDHIADAVEIAQRLEPQVLCPVEVGTYLESQGVENVVAFNKGGTVTVRNIRFTMTFAVHSGGIDTPEGIVYGGEPAGYVIRFENGYSVYQAGDTAAFSDMALIRELYSPDLAVLPIGDFYTMGPYEAAYAVRLLGVEEVLPGHYGTFPPLVGTPAALREELAKLGLEHVEVHEPEPGETLP